MIPPKTINELLSGNPAIHGASAIAVRSMNLPNAPRPKLANSPWPSPSPAPSAPQPITVAAVGKFLAFTVAILLNVLLSFLALVIGHKFANPSAVGESFNLLASMLMIGAAIACPVVALSWLIAANTKSPAFRWETLAIPLIYVPAIAWFGGMILGGVS